MPPPKRATKVRPASNETFEGFDYPGADEVNVPPTTFDGYIRCFFGKKGIGKSTLVSTFPNALTLMFEPRRRNLAIRQLNLQKRIAKEILQGEEDVWNKIKLTTQRWIDDESIDCINFDSVDIAYECCYHSVCAANGVAKPNDAGKASVDVWNEIRDEWACYFDALAASRLGVNFVSHVKSRDTEQLDGGKIEVNAPSCTPACLQYIKQACDFVFYYGDYNSKRAMQLRDPTGMAWVAVGAQNAFMQPNGKPINILEMPDLTSKTTGYQHLVKAFNNECWDIDTEEEDKKVVKKGPPRR